MRQPTQQYTSKPHTHDPQGVTKNTTVITTTAGPVVGRDVEGVLQLRGIPFARSPVGELSDKPPEPPAPWVEPLEALEPGPAPLQPQLFGMGMRSATNVSADCLTLNVDAPLPEKSTHTKRPIMMWIFGGGYITGDAADELFDGTALARQGMVVVRANYRLGALGRANLGLADQLLALRWVHDNAEALGGDAECITLFGESAGAMSICNLLTAPAAKGLFHRAIAQSGAGSNVATSEQAAVANDRWISERAKLTDPEDAEALMALQSRLGRELRPQFGGMPFRPVVDGTLLPAHPEQAASNGADVPLLIGHNADEHRLYMNPRHRLAPGGLNEELGKRLPAAVIDALEHHYPQFNDVERLAAAETELRYRAPQERYVAARERSRTDAGLGANTWTYRFNWPSPALRGWLGACHAIEIPFVFGNFTQRTMAKFVGPGYEPLSAEVQSLWCHFARVGKPPELWKPYPNVMELHPGTQCRPRSEVEAFWNESLGSS